MKPINSKHDSTVLYRGHKEKSMNGGVMGIKGSSPFCLLLHFPSVPFWLISASPKLVTTTSYQYQHTREENC
jgi:hypothetical protein